MQAAPGRVFKAAAAAVQVLISYLDKALGLRVQGMVAEVSLKWLQCLAVCVLWLWCELLRGGRSDARMPST